MKHFPTHPIELNKMFKKTGLYVVNPEMEDGLFYIKLHVSKVKSKLDLENAYLKIENCANENGFETKLKGWVASFSDFRFHGSYYEIYFYAK